VLRRAVSDDNIEACEHRNTQRVKRKDSEAHTNPAEERWSTFRGDVFIWTVCEDVGL